MMLLGDPKARLHRNDYWLGGGTAGVAGFVNVCSVIAFFAFSSNVTGHVAIFAEEAVKGHWHQLSVVLAWVLLFLFGAFVSNFSVTALGSRYRYAGRGAPLVLQLLLLGAVGYYGQHHYLETLKETEYLVGLLVFCMGLQNGIVASVSGGVVKTTHLTGLFTDLGMELSMMLQRRFRRDEGVRFKFVLHVVILLSYVLGGIVGGVLFLQHGFSALYMASAALFLILAHDVVLLLAQQHRALAAESEARRNARSKATLPAPD